MSDKKPEAPEGLKAARDEEGNVTVTWERRPYLVGERGPEIIVGAGGEEYTVEIVKPKE